MTGAPSRARAGTKNSRAAAEKSTRGLCRLWTEGHIV